MTNPINLTRRNALKSMAGLLIAPVLAYPSQASVGKNPRTMKFVPVMVTPYRQDLTIDYEMLRQLTDFYKAAGAEGYFANCLSSEMYYLNNQERIAITETVVKRVPQSRVVSTGSFGDSLNEQIDFCKRIADTGISGSILITSHFATKQESDSVMMDNLGEFINKTGKIPLGTYECPSPYKRLLTPEVYQTLVRTNRFFYHKDTSENLEQITRKIELSQSSKMEFYNAHSATAVASLQRGGNGLSPISGNFYPEILAWICKHANNPAKKNDLQWIQEEIAQTEPLISIKYPVGSKYFLKKRGLPIEIVTRYKNRELTKADTAQLDQVYERFKGWCERLDIKPAKI